MWPLTHHGLFTAHDIWHQVARLYHYHSVLSAGFWPPGWVIDLTHGFGYPLFYFSYHLPWLVGEPLLRLGLSLPVTLKVLFGGAVFLSGLTMYWFCWQLIRKTLPAVLGAVVYIVAPYHFLTVYVAAAIGTVFQFIFIPLMFGGAYLIIVKKTKTSGSVILALGIAGSVLSHLMSTVMVLPFLGIWSLVLLVMVARTNIKLWGMAIFKMGTGVLFGLLLSAFYLLPLFAYKPAIIADSAGGFRSLYSSHFVSLKQLLYSAWGFSPIVSNAKDREMSLQVGVVQWLGVGALFAMVFATVVSLWAQKSHQKVAKQFLSRLALTLDLRQSVVSGVAVLILFAVVCLSMLELAAPVWEFANRFMTLDYPWRLLLLAVFFGSTAVALSLSYIKPLSMKVIFFVIIIASAWYTNRNHIGVNLYTDVPVADYVEAETTTNTFAEYLPRGASEDVTRVKDQPFILDSQGISTITTQSAVAISAEVIASSSGTFTLRQFSFPTLAVYVDDTQVPSKNNNKGLIQIELEQGEHTVELKVVKPAIVRLGMALTIASLLGLTGYILWNLKNLYVKK